MGEPTTSAQAAPGNELLTLPSVEEGCESRSGEPKEASQPPEALPLPEGEPVPGAPHLRIIPGGREVPRPHPLMAREPLVAAQDAEGRALLVDLAAKRELGLYISGLPGVGKSTLLLHLILEDIQASRGCCVLDPHGDLVAAVLARCPLDDRVLGRILLFDPGDTEWPIPLNIMNACSERARDLAVQFMIDLYEELFLPDHQGPMLHQSVRNGMRLIMEVGGTLPEVALLFTVRDFLKARLAQCQDPWVRHYFEGVWAKMSESSRGEYLGYFTSKLSRFIEDRMVRNILGQPGGVNLDEFLSGGGILLANLARGATGDLNSRLLGMILLHKLERATLERSSLEQNERNPVNIYVDEFHEFCTTSLINFLGAARKFNVGLTLAHQRLEILPPAIQEAVLGSIAHFVLCRQSSGEGLRALPPLVWPRFGERELLRLPNYQAVARVTRPDGQARLGRLRIPGPGAGSGAAAMRVRQLSREQFARPRAQVEAELLSHLGWNTKPSDA